MYIYFYFQNDYKSANQYGNISLNYASTKDQKEALFYILGSSYYHLVYNFIIIIQNEFEEAIPYLLSALKVIEKEDEINKCNLHLGDIYCKFV